MNEGSKYAKRLYRIWHGMKQRCGNPNNLSYKYYGGKGIEVCFEWLDFKVFMRWALSNGYQDKLTIDRKDVKQGYNPENCQWITLSENTSKAQLENGHTFIKEIWAYDKPIKTRYNLKEIPFPEVDKLILSILNLNKSVA